MISFFADTEQQTEELAARIASKLKEMGTLANCLVIFLYGDLGAGKTTFVRALLTALGYSGAVRSPTYNIVQPYSINDFSIYHFDLYRIVEPEELDALGMRDYFEKGNLCFLEWPEKGAGLLPEADLSVTIEYEGNGRLVRLQPNSDDGHKMIP